MTRIVFALLVCSLGSNLNAQSFGQRGSITDTLEIPVRYESVRGYRIAYYEAGPPNGEVVVLIPTLRWSAHSWAQNLPHLAHTHRVIAIDPLGTGYSDKPVIDYKMDTWTDSFAEFLRIKRIDQAVFIGTEMGGALAVEMALSHPRLVRGIVVAASNSGPGLHEGGARRGMGGPTREGTRAGLLQELFDSTLVTDDVVQTILARRMRAGDGHTIRSHVSDHRPRYTPEELARIQAPALFLWCREDRITPPRWGEDFAAPLPNARFRLLEGCGHYPNLERPGLFNDGVSQFLQTLGNHTSPASMAGAWHVVGLAVRSPGGEWEVRPQPQGGLYVFSDRHYSYVYVPGGRARPRFGNPNSPSDAEKAAAYDTFIAGAGSYTFDGSTLVLKADLRKNPNEMTGDLWRWKVDVMSGDTVRFIFENPPFLPGRDWRTTLVRAK